ncbi:unnamed protein product [Cercospora beticola]|nr:unnamed protein product [Cercospora beticola]
MARMAAVMDRGCCLNRRGTLVRIKGCREGTAREVRESPASMGEGPHDEESRHRSVYDPRRLSPITHDESDAAPAWHNGTDTMFVLRPYCIFARQYDAYSPALRVVF